LICFIETKVACRNPVVFVLKADLFCSEGHLSGKELIIKQLRHASAKSA
jgi:hypothetical protein